MFDSPTLSVSELASRWGKTPRQILDHAKALHIPLHFMFEGLAFDESDALRHVAILETIELDHLQKIIAAKQARIEQNLHGETDQFAHLDHADIFKLRTEIEADRDKCELLFAPIEKHQRDRQSKSYHGLMRATFRMLEEIEQGKAVFAEMGFHPDYSVKSATIPGEPGHYLQGRLMWLEPVFDAVPITTENLMALTRDVRAIEAQWQAATASATPEPQAAPESAQAARRTLWDVVTPHIVNTMQAGQFASAKELFNALEKKAGPDSPFDKGVGNNRQGLFVREAAQTLSLKTLQNNWPKLLEVAKK